MSGRCIEGFFLELLQIVYRNRHVTTALSTAPILCVSLVEFRAFVDRILPVVATASHFSYQLLIRQCH